MTYSQVTALIPEAVFREPDYQAAHRWSTDAYVDEVVAILQEAAGVGLTDPYWLTKPGKPLQDLTTRGAARLLLQQLVEDDRNTRAFMAVKHLQPELGLVITCIRRMIASDARLQAAQHMTALRARVAEFTSLQPGT